MDGHAVLTHSAEETRALAALFGESAQAGDVVVLRGDLGAGKSEFARGYARGLGISGPIPSPSFTILNAYDIGRLPLSHFDWYRVEDAEELHEIGAEEQLPGEGATLIEWAERAEELLPERRLEVWITSLSETDRKLVFCPLGGFQLPETTEPYFHQNGVEL